MKVLMIVNDTNFAWNLRREVLCGFVAKGWETVLLSHILDFRKDFEDLGVRLIDLPIDRRGTNPLKDMKLISGYHKILKSERPDVVLINNTKPNIYAGIACQRLKLKYMANVTGLGTAVENPGKLQRFSIFLYRKGVKKASTLFFQNKDNMAFFTEHKMLPKNARTVLLPGSGVNLETHPVLPWPQGEIHFLYVARIMKEKGIDDYLEAARRFSREGVVFDVCGQCDDPKYLEMLKNEPSIVYHGLQRDVLPFYEKCSCFVYPSYYPEGMSNVCLEAAACGRPVIVADRAGCRETVDDGKTGYVVPIKDREKLFEAIEKFLSLSSEQRCEMGLAGKRKMEREFDRKLVSAEYIREIEHLFDHSNET